MWRVRRKLMQRKEKQKSFDLKHTIKKKLIIAIILLSIAIGQLVIVVASRSILIWRSPYPSSFNGERTITLPKTYLLYDRYIITVYTKFEQHFMDDTAGQITLKYLKTNKTYTLNYIFSSNYPYNRLEIKAKSYHMLPGKYNISWTNNQSNYYYMICTHGLFCFNYKTERYPYNAETVTLVISLVIFPFILIAALRYFIEVRRDLKLLAARDQSVEED